MCGIVGYIGKQNGVPFLLQGLEKLEYRGYDSAGIAISGKEKIRIVKKQGRISNIEKIIKEDLSFKSNLAIGHTRWATHGKPSDINSHPQVSSCGKFAIVHNGIIENYLKIKSNLIEKGYTFSSETDTEVVVQLISYLYNGNLMETINKTVSQLEGSFALGIICNDYPDTLVAACKDSTLVIGVGENENYIASDIPALLAETRNICRLKSNQIAVLKYNDFEIFDFDKTKVEKNLTKIDWNIDSAEKNGYEHFMIKEIMEQPEVISKTMSPRLDKENNIILDNIVFSEDYINNLRRIFIVACGSAYHVGCAAKYFMENTLNIPVDVDIASEFRYKSPIIDSKTLVIIISQSGETADSIAALREAKSKGARILSVVNVIGSTIANESDDVLYTYAGPEIAVATTKAYSSQLFVLYLLTLKFGNIIKKIDNEKLHELVEALKELPSKIKSALNLNDDILKIAQEYYQYEKIFFIGRNFDYAVCMEGSLKLKEISYIHSEAYAAGELKHGTISLIDENTLVVAIATHNALIDKLVSNIREVKSRGAKILSVTTESQKNKISEVSDDVVVVPEILDMFMPSLAIIPMQLFSYYMAKLRNCDIDKPRNLAKSVTVE